MSNKEIFNFILKGKYSYHVAPKAPNNTPPHPTLIWKFGQISSMIAQAAEIANTRLKKAELFVCLGRDTGKRVIVNDFASEIRQLLITGMQGSGKSNALSFILLSLFWGNHLGTVEFHLFDIKRELSVFSPLAKIYSEVSEIKTGIQRIKERMDKRYRFLQGIGFRNISECNTFFKKMGLDPIKRHFIIIDEYASTNLQIEDFDDTVVTLCNTARAAGFYFIICTQRADRGSLSPKIKANIGCNLSFSQRDEVNAKVSGVQGASSIRKVGSGIININNDLINVSFPEVKIDLLKVAISKMSRKDTCQIN